jgi:hypothetical protein
MDHIQCHQSQRINCVSEARCILRTRKLLLRQVQEGQGEISHDGSLEVWKDTLFPKLDEIIAQFSQRLNKRIIPIYQDNNAAAHHEHIYWDWLKAEYANRGGLVVPQPQNSPTTNVLDDYIFPSMSKLASTQQDLRFGGQTLNEGELWGIMQRVFYE